MQLEIEGQALKKEKDKASKERRDKLNETLKGLKEKSRELNNRWQVEKLAISEMRSLKEQMEQVNVQMEQAERRQDLAEASRLRYGVLNELKQKLEAAEAKISEIQAGEPLLKEEVDDEEIAEVVSKWTHIPVSRLLEGEMQKLLHMEDRLHERVVGQEEAIRAISNAVRRTRAGLQDPNRPIGSFIFLGPTGVGKTELARSLAAFMFDD